MNSGAEVRLGTFYGAGAYFLWGAFPLYFRLLDRAAATRATTTGPARSRSCSTSSEAEAGSR